MQGAPLAQDFGIRAGVNGFVYCDACAFVAGDVTNAIAAGLNAMQIDRCEQLHYVCAFF